MHLHFPDHHGETSPDDQGPSPAWALDNVELTTVGVDVGSSTSHLLFGRVHLQRPAQSLSSRYQVVERQVLHRSAVQLTPFRPDGLIDVAALESIVDLAYAEAGLAPEEVDTGAVILTGVALERANARAVAELFSERGGDFVCAAAGHNLESMLAAHGSGAVARSRRVEGRQLHVDIGGGTSKLALLEGGEIIATAAIGVGGRLVVEDLGGRVLRTESSARSMAAELGIDLRVGAAMDAGLRRQLCEGLAKALLEAAKGGPPPPLAARLLLTEPLPEAGHIDTWTCSGGVAEYLAGRESMTFGDIAPDLAAAIAGAGANAGLALQPVADGIRATALGASQFTVQLSGSTVHLPEHPPLPVRNLPVVRVRLPSGALDELEVSRSVAQAFRRLDLEEGAQPVALALPWQGEPHYRELRALARGVARALPRSLSRGLPLVVACAGDVGKSLGAILTDELGVGVDVVALDGLELLDLDYVDIGRRLEPAGVVPVVIKSLAFPPAEF